MLHLITGGSGFLGQRIVRKLLERGESVRILDTLPNPKPTAGEEFYQVDVRDREAVRRAMKGVSIVHHNAALVPLTKAKSDFWSVNVDGSQVVAEEAARAGVSSFVHMSSSAIFGLVRSPIHPDTEPHPVEEYGESKLEGERAVQRVLEKSGTSLLTVRPRTILGPGRLGIFQILFQWISEGRPIYLIGKGDGGYQFVHVRDLMDAYWLALEKGKTGVLNVGTDRFTSLHETLAGLIRHAGTKSKIRKLPIGVSTLMLTLLDRAGLSPLAPWHYLSYHHPFYFDTAPLHQLGWRAQYSNQEMLVECYDWYLENRRRNFRGEGSPQSRPVGERALWFLKHFR